MKYFLDCEFHERFYHPAFGRKNHIVELISIGMVAEDGSEFYAISNEFDLKAAWDNEWLRENVLKPIHSELYKEEGTYGKTHYWELYEPFTLKSIKNLLKWHGQSLQEIKCDLLGFLGIEIFDYKNQMIVPQGIEIYGYYCDYDWVVFCSLFGTMMDLPVNMPMYCRDLKQILDEKIEVVNKYPHLSIGLITLNTIQKVKAHGKYPVQENEHNALDDAKWNQKLYHFIKEVM